jgi:hypothetical protein
MRKAYKDLISDLYYQIALLQNQPKFNAGDKVEIIYDQPGLAADPPKKGTVKDLSDILIRPVEFGYLGIKKYVATPVYFVDVGDQVWEVQQWRLR